MRAALRVLSGTAYYYHWKGEEPALLAFTPLGQLGWCLEEIRGHRNGFVSGQTRVLIHEALAASKILCPAPAEDWLFNGPNLRWALDLEV